LLKLGRHLRWDDSSKIIVGRREEENERMELLWDPGDFRLLVKDIPGPLVILPGDPAPSGEAIRFAARAAARYSDAPEGVETEVTYTDGNNHGSIWIQAYREEEFQEKML